jgi:NAD(P)-dependent dehydrogenase (short-subunit alcohol dehydrogenase family)
MAFQGRTALVSGAASGIGRAAALRLARAGARVVALDVDADGLRALADAQGGIEPHVLDVADPRAVAEQVAKSEAESGPFDRVLCCAGVMPTGRVLEQDPARVLRAMQVNYGGALNLAHAALPAMLARGRGEFALLSSVLGWMPGLLLGAYAASKFALVALAEVLAHENRGRGVRFCCVCPSAVDTPMYRAPAGPLRPRSMDQAKLLTPDAVVDALERSLERGQLLCFPGRSARAAWLLRRLAPRFLWRQIHRIEGW